MSRRGHFTSETCLAITKKKILVWECTYRVNSFWRNVGRVSLTNEFGSECHPDEELLTSGMAELRRGAQLWRGKPVPGSKCEFRMNSVPNVLGSTGLRTI